MYEVGEQKVPLCPDCFLKFSQVQGRELENNERMNDLPGNLIEVD